MLDKLRKRLRSEKGFTLIELLVVMIILAILTAIAIPSYLSFKDRANKSAAGADVRSLIPSVESFFSDNGTYSGMTVSYLKTNYDQAIDLSTYTLGAAGNQTATSYCVQASSQNQTAAKAGPSAQIVIGGTCP
jgi:prepilin-type N-terminal cleavage/methylation domain-containing protein